MSGGYNGWRNYETWLFNIWMTNDGSDYWWERAREIARDHIDDGKLDQDGLAIELADAIRDETDEYLDSLDLQGFVADLVNASTSSIDWIEIAEHIVSDIADEIEIECAEECE